MLVLLGDEHVELQVCRRLHRDRDLPASLGHVDLEVGDEFGKEFDSSREYKKLGKGVAKVFVYVVGSIRRILIVPCSARCVVVKVVWVWSGKFILLDRGFLRRNNEAWVLIAAIPQLDFLAGLVGAIAILDQCRLTEEDLSQI